MRKLFHIICLQTSTFRPIVVRVVMRVTAMAVILLTGCQTQPPMPPTPPPPRKAALHSPKVAASHSGHPMVLRVVPQGPPAPPGAPKQAERIFRALTLMNPPSPSVSLAWDGVNDPRVSNYRVYWGLGTGLYTNSTMVATTNATIAPLAYSTTYHFAATSITTNGLESVYSAEALSTTASPPPTNVVYTIQMMSATSVTGPFTNVGVPYLVTNPPSPQLFFKLTLMQTNY